MFALNYYSSLPGLACSHYLARTIHKLYNAIINSSLLPSDLGVCYTIYVLTQQHNQKILQV